MPDHRPDHPSTDSSPIRAVGIIPARWGATRFPGKLLADLVGVPVIGHTCRQASGCVRLAELVVATDDERIAKAVTDIGGRAVMTSPHHTSGTDRVAEVAGGLDQFDVVVNIQGDEPLIVPDTIDALVSAFDDPSVEIATMNSNVDLGHGPGLGFKHVGLYGYRRSTLLRLAQLPPSPLERAEGLEQLRFLEGGYRIRVLYTAEESVGVDTPEDLEQIKAMFCKE